MRSTYRDELNRLAETYRRALQLDVGALVELHAAIGGQPALFVASGGGLAVAQIAAERHIAAHGELAMAMTPLTLVGEATVRHAAVVAISASAAHPDVAFALRAARTRHNYPVALVTHRRVQDLDPSLLRLLTSVIHVPNTGRDGFLATNSVLALATLFVRAADPELQLPSALPYLTKPSDRIRHSRCLILCGPGQRSAAIDLETRLSELGFAAAQVADYRNFAHGRHTGLSRNLSDTTVVAFASPSDDRLARATLDILPSETDVIPLFSELAEPAAALDLLAASMRLVGISADGTGVEPARPRVPLYGRRLYHLAAKRYTTVENHGPVQRKLSAIAAPSSRLLRDRYTRALSEWISDISAVDFKAVVIDYDGTVCSTRDRFELPRTDVRDQLIRLLDGGCYLGFASGRGRSLHTDLRRWVPRPYWPNVTLGLYNGGILLQGLDKLLPEQETPYSALVELGVRLAEEPLAELVKIDSRAWQLSVEPVTGTGIGVDTVAEWIADSLARAPHLNLKLLRSGHSVDVVEPSTSKVSVIDTIESAAGGPAIAIGDRGNAGGNDFELLASRRWTVSVDRCSGDQTRCWNLSPPGVLGPDALIAYLRRIRQRQGGWRFRPPTA